MREDLNGEYPFEALDRAALAERMPAVGPDVVGGTFHPDDGHINPLKMCRALQSAFLKRGGRLYPGRAVDSIVPLSGGGFPPVGAAAAPWRPGRSSSPPGSAAVTWRRWSGSRHQ